MQYAPPQTDRRQPVQPQQSFSPPQHTPPAPLNQGQQQYGFVNFEPLPVEPAADAPSAEPENAVPQNLSDAPVAPAAAEGTEQKQKGINIPAAPNPPKQRAQSRNQINERDYSVYRIDSAQQSSSNGTNDVEDSDIRTMDKNDVPPGKQQKGFLSKFFNREEQ
jgi:hypothetical protein